MSNLWPTSQTPTEAHFLLSSNDVVTVSNGSFLNKNDDNEEENEEEEKWKNI